MAVLGFLKALTQGIVGKIRRFLERTGAISQEQVAAEVQQAFPGVTDRNALQLAQRSLEALRAGAELTTAAGEEAISRETIPRVQGLPSSYSYTVFVDPPVGFGLQPKTIVVEADRNLTKDELSDASIKEYRKLMIRYSTRQFEAASGAQDADFSISVFAAFRKG